MVTGWYAPEIEMFGTKLLPHDERYEVAQEWFDIVRQAWTADEPFSYGGKYYNVENALLKPKPIQQPYPLVMNAGGSPKGREFGARNCDVVFINADLGQHTPGALAKKVASFKQLAFEQYGREIQVWTNAYVVEADTEADAQKFLDYYVNELGDWEAAENLVSIMGLNAMSNDPATLQDMKFHFIAGWGGFPIVGTKEHTVDTLDALTKAGLDGVLLSFPRYIEDMGRFQEQTYPLLVEAGLR